MLPIVGFCKPEANALGPFQEYVGLPLVPADKLNVVPEQTGLLLDAVGADGVTLIVTETVPAAPVHPFLVAVTEYVPDSAVVTLPIVGFCKVDVNPFGPLHE